MINLLVRLLHPMGKEAGDVVCVVGVDILETVDPRPRLRRVAERRLGRLVQIEDAGVRAGEPTGLNCELVSDQLVVARAPRHLLYRPVPVEPRDG